MHITDNIISKPIKRADGTCAMLKLTLPILSADDREGKRGARNEKRLNEFLTGLCDRMEQKALLGTCDHYILVCKITYLDDSYISMFFEAWCRKRGKTVSYSPFSATFSFVKGSFCRCCEFCTKQDVKNISKNLPDCDVKYSYYLNDGCVTFYEKRHDSNRVAKVSVSLSCQTSRHKTESL